MDRLMLVLSIAALAVVVAVVVNRRTVRPVTAVTGRAPASVARGDFAGPDLPVLVAVFSSSTCDACAQVERLLPNLVAADVVTTTISWQRHPELHERYAIPAVPTTLVVDRDGTVTYSVIGEARFDELAAAIETLR